MNINEFGLCTNQRQKKKALKVVYLQNGISAQAEKRNASTVTSGATKSTERWHSESNSVTAVSNTTITTVEESGIIVAITEGRGEASCEVGMAAMNVQHPELSLFQISDASSYIKVLNKIHILNPCEILVPATLSTSRLVDALKSTFPSVKMVAIDRFAFQKSSGQQFVRDVCAKVYNPVLLVLQHKYYTLTATGALQLYLDSYKRQFYAKESMKVTYSESDYNTIIDVFVADKLELVACALGNGHDSIHKKHSSLRGILNHCITKLGSRLLRSTILQPPNQLEEIQIRLNCIEELVKCPERLMSIRDSLAKLKNFGQVLSLATILKSNGLYCDERHLNYVLNLKSFFDEIEPLKELLAPCKATFFHQVLDTLKRDEFQALNNAFARLIEEDARPTTGEQGRLSRWFAVKGGHSNILDFLRTKFSQRVEEMRAHVAERAAEVGYNLRLANNQKKGYHMVMQFGAKQRSQFKKSSLPPDFCQVDVMATMVTMKTIKLLTMSNLLEDTATEIIKISNTYIHELLLEVHKNISLLYLMCEQVAKLDLVQSLAHASASGNRYVRPNFDNFTKVIDARHPLLDYILDKEPVANNIIVTPENRLHLITGPNGSGKSIYIRQIVLLQVMAQIGCFVPATSATFRICDRILARIYFEDNMECGASAFMLEMKDIKYFFNVITDKTLIIIDELCRSTAVREGTALAMSICEHLMRTPAFIYFTTHYTYITKLQQMYPDIRCWQMETNEVRQNARKPRLVYTYKLIPGVVTLEAYGLALARFVWPEDITKDCEDILTKIYDKSLETSIDKKLALKINLENTLIELKRVGKCDKYTAYQLWQEYVEALKKLGVIINLEDCNNHNEQTSSNSNKTSTPPENATQTDNIDMNLTLQDNHAEIHDRNHILEPSASTSMTNYTENSYLAQNRFNQSDILSERIINSSNTSHSTNYTGAIKRPVRVLQNITLPKHSLNTSQTGSKITPKGGLLFRSYSGLASREEEILHDKNDYTFVSIMEHKDKEQSFNHSLQASQISAKDRFDTFTQNIKDMQQQQTSQHNPNEPLTKLPWIDFENFDEGMEVGSGNDISFGDYEGKSLGGDNNKIDFFQLNTSPKSANPFENDSSLSDNDLDYDFCPDPAFNPNELVPAVQELRNNSLTSLTSTNFMTNLRVENASTPLPNVALPLNDIESRLQYAKASLEAQAKNSSSSDEFNTNLIKNVLSPCTFTTKSEEPSKKQRLLEQHNIFDQSIAASLFNEEEDDDEEPQPVINLCSPKKQKKAKTSNMFNKRELVEFYDQKRMNAMQSTNNQEREQYCQEVMNRPSIKQLQATEVVMTARRTSDGQCVFDVPKKPKRFQAPFKRHDSLSHSRNVQFDTRMFSDENSRIFDEFMEHKRSSSGRDTMDFEEFKQKQTHSNEFLFQN